MKPFDLSRIASLGEIKSPETTNRCSCSPVLSNGGLLQLSAGLFFLFVVAEFGGAYYSGSLGLLGDASAMTVDVFTYLGNFVAERMKRSYSSTTTRQFKVTTKIFAPLFAVTTLFVITGLILYKAITVLLYPPAEDNVDSEMMYTFAIINFAIDVICVVAFAYRGKDVFYESRGVPQLSLDTSVHSEGSDDFGHLDDDLELQPTRSGGGGAGGAGGDYPTTLLGLLYTYYCCPCRSGARFATTDEKNLNMLSAFTHLSGDTLRTISVFLAAVIATLTHINSDVCDAWAAIVVSGTIVLIMIPLIRDIIHEISEACGSWSDYGEDEQEYQPVSTSNQMDGEEAEPIYKSNLGVGASVAGVGQQVNAFTTSSPPKRNKSPSNLSDNDYGSVRSGSDNSYINLSTPPTTVAAAAGKSIATVAAQMKNQGRDTDRIDDYLFVDEIRDDDSKEKLPF